MVNFNDYEEFIDPVLCENPVMFLEKIRNGNDELPLDNTDIIKYSTLIRKLWEPHKRENIQINLTVEKKTVEHSENDVIFDYNFINLIRDIKQNGKAKSANIIINENGYICDIIQLNDNITVNYSIIKSKEKILYVFSLVTKELIF